MKTIKVARKDGDIEVYRFLLLGPRCTPSYFHMSLQHIFGSLSTSGCFLSLIDQAGKKVQFEDLTEGGTYYVLFEGDGGSFEDSGADSELIDSQLQDSGRLKVLLPDAYLSFTIDQVRVHAQELVRQLTSRLDYSRAQLAKPSQQLTTALGSASADFLTYASEVNAVTYRKSLIFPGLSEAITDAKSLIQSLTTAYSVRKSVIDRPQLSKISPEKLPSMVITRKMMDEAGVNKAELKRFLKFASRSSSEVQSEATSHVTTPKATKDNDRSPSSSLLHDGKSVSAGSDTSVTRERKLLTRLRDKAKASETVLKNAVAAFWYQDAVVSRIQMIVLNGSLKLSGLGRGNKTLSFPLLEMESVKRSDEYDRTLVVRFQDSKELKLGFTDDPTYHSWVGAFEDQMALIRGSLVSPKKLRDGLS